MDRRRLLGVGLVVVSAAGFGSGTILSKPIYATGLETVPASLAGVLVYLYPAVVAVLSIRYATRLSGRRPWIALAIALTGVVLALGGIDLTVSAPLGGLALVL